MIIAITGGSGLIGSRLVRLHVERGDEVRVLTRGNHHIFPEKIQLFYGDLGKEPSYKYHKFLNNVDVFYHCAGEVKNEGLMEQVHVKGTQQLIAAANGRIKRWVQLSSVGVYGKVTSGVVRENNKRQPIGRYEETKNLSDHYVMLAADAGMFECVILRPSNVIAPDMSNQSLFQWMRMIKNGRFFYIGRKGAIVNYIHAANVAHALVLCGISREADNQVFIVSEFMSVEEFVGKICQSIGCPEPRVRIPKWVAILVALLMQWKEHFPLTLSRVLVLTSKCVYSSAKIEKTLGYRPIITLDDTINEMASLTQFVKD